MQRKLKYIKLKKNKKLFHYLIIKDGKYEYLELSLTTMFENISHYDLFK